MSDSKLSWEQAVQWLRDQPDKKVLVQHCYYDDPLSEAAERFSVSEEWQEILKLVKEKLPGKVLDLGAGRGISSYAFAKAGCEVVALEPDASDLVGAGAIRSLIDNSNLSIEIVQEYGEVLPFADNTFDIVYGRAVLHHANDLEKLCKETARVLKPGGVLIATREHVITKSDDLQLFLDGHALHFLYGGEHAYLLNEYVTAITDAGLDLKPLIGPYDSVINYAPQSKEQFRMTFSYKLKNYFGTVLSNQLSKIDVFLSLYGRKLSNASNLPGRHYSFMAIKHE